MAANRRRKERKRRGFYFHSLLLFISLTMVAFLYVWQQIQFVRVGYSLKRLEKRVEEARKDNRALRLRVSALKSPSRIEAMIAKRGIVLRPPKESQIVRIYGPGVRTGGVARLSGGSPAAVAASSVRQRTDSVL